MTTFELHGADLPKRRMPAPGIVERFNVVEDVGACRIACRVGLPLDTLLLAASVACRRPPTPQRGQCWALARCHINRRAIRDPVGPPGHSEPSKQARRAPFLMLNIARIQSDTFPDRRARGEEHRGRSVINPGESVSADRTISHNRERPNPERQLKKDVIVEQRTQIEVPNTRSQSEVVTPKFPGRSTLWWCRQCRRLRSLR